MTEQQETTAKITAIHPDRTSSSSTPYCAIELEGFSEWFFIWEGDFKDDIENFIEVYRDAEIKVIYTDKESDPDDHFYNIDKFWPTSKEKCQKLLRLKMKTDNPEPKISREEINEYYE